MTELAPHINVDEDVRAVLIGGGNTYEEGKPMLAESLEMTGADKPNILIVDTASKEKAYTERYHAGLTAAYTDLGVSEGDIDVLHPYLLRDIDEATGEIFNNKPFDLSRLLGDDQMIEMFSRADVIYVPGGNTRKMFTIWGETIIGDLVEDAIARRVVMSGHSAGMIDLFAAGHSDSNSFEVAPGEDWDYTMVNGLGKIGTSGIPHFDGFTLDGQGKKAEPREVNFEKMVRGPEFDNRDRFAIGVDNNAGIVVDGGLIKATRGHAEEGSESNRRGVFAINARGEETIRTRIDPSDGFIDINEAA